MEYQSSIIDNHLQDELSHHSFVNNSYFPSLPTGYRFEPYDHELIVHYLEPKVANKPLPPNKISEIDVYRFHPMKLSEMMEPQREGIWYFFSPRERRYKNGDRPRRDAGKGFWKATAAERAVTYNGVTIGYKTSLAYYKGKPPNDHKTSWLMHEYRLHKVPQRQRSTSHDMRLDDIVICKIYETKYKTNSRKEKSCILTEGDNDEKECPHSDNGDEFSTISMFSQQPQFENPSQMSSQQQYGSQFSSASDDGAGVYGVSNPQYIDPSILIHAPIINNNQIPQESSLGVISHFEGDINEILSSPLHHEFPQMNQVQQEEVYGVANPEDFDPLIDEDNGYFSYFFGGNYNPY